jgi:spoIIIJ-associated protein
MSEQDTTVEQENEVVLDDLTAAGAPAPSEPGSDTVSGAEPDDSTGRDLDDDAEGSDDEHLEREGEIAADFLEKLLDIADLDGDIDVDVDGDRASVAIVDSEEGRVPRRLVGQDARVLDALQELTRLAVQASTGERSRLMLDVAGYRAQRRAELVSIAREAIEQVRSSGERESLEPMTAFERKVVHDEVLAAGLSSESEGADPNRHVVVLPDAQRD